MYYDRESKRTIELQEHKQSSVNFLYKNAFGRVLLKLIVARPWFSKLCGVYYNSKLSQKDIAPFINQHKINLGKNTVQDFTTFNEFFTRERNDLGKTTQYEFPAVADSKLTCYAIGPGTCLDIKNSKYTIEELVGKNIAKHFGDGLCLVFRLSVDDNHRYIYPDNGSMIFHKKIKGVLHTVRPISSEYKVFSHNCREVTLLETENFGKMAMIEVGATLVGKIKNHHKQNFLRNDEKGYFEFGGSTIVVLLENKIQIDQDIIDANEKDFEVKVKAGERIGVKC